MMVDVVDAMMACGPARLETRASTSRLRSSTSGTPSKMTAASAMPACASASADTTTREAMVSTASGGEQPEAGERGKRAAHLVAGVVQRCLRSPSSLARLDVNDRHAMPGIGEHDRDAARHAARAEAGDRRASAHLNLRQEVLGSARDRDGRGPGSPACGCLQKSSPQIAPPIARNARRERRRQPARAARPRRERTARCATSSTHVAMLRQHDLLAPVARSR